MTRYRQAHRPAPIWIGLIGLIGYAVVGTAIVYLAFVLLAALAGDIPAALR